MTEMGQYETTNYKTVKSLWALLDIYYTFLSELIEVKWLINDTDIWLIT